jgi:hypothetical protein
LDERGHETVSLATGRDEREAGLRAELTDAERERVREPVAISADRLCAA